MPKQQPDKVSSDPVVPEEAIAIEVEGHLRALNSLCTYMGWQHIADTLHHARAELIALVREKQRDAAMKQAPISFVPFGSMDAETDGAG